ncbi:hypothetical protein ACFIOY_32615 [Bradyrhizobium sp. TZ2]
MDRLLPNTDTDFRIATRKAGLAPAFFWFGEGVDRLFRCVKIIFALQATFCHDALLWFGRLVVGQTNMRVFALGLIFSAAAFPCLAQTVLKTEPLILAPYEVAFVQDPSCGAGKVRKVTGVIRGLQRRKACVTLASEQASLLSATP